MRRGLGLLLPLVLLAQGAQDPAELRQKLAAIQGRLGQVDQQLASLNCPPSPDVMANPAPIATTCAVSMSDGSPHVFTMEPTTAASLPLINTEEITLFVISPSFDGALDH